jgi:hypothetical protein
MHLRAFHLNVLLSFAGEIKKLRDSTVVGKSKKINSENNPQN